MPDFLERAVSGRAKCRGCGRSIGKGDWRFGEALPNAYGEGESLHWFDLVCAACMRPEKMRDALRSSGEPVPDRAWLERTAEFGALHPRLARLARAERASSGRARCQQCRELVEKDAWRLPLQVFEDGRMNAIGFVHLRCAPAYAETSDLADRIRHLSPDLTSDDVADIERLLADAPLAPLAKAGADEGNEAREQDAPSRSAG
jgi:hypothetical protein